MTETDFIIPVEFNWHKNYKNPNRPKQFDTVFFIRNKQMFLGYYYEKYDRSIEKNCGFFVCSISNNIKTDSRNAESVFRDNEISYWAYMPKKPF